MQLLKSLMGRKAGSQFGVSHQVVNLNGSYHNITANEYKTRFHQEDVAHTLIDVRSPAEFAGGHLAEALNIPLQELAARLSEISKSVPVTLYCRTGNRSGMAAQMLHNAGYTDVYNIGGLGDLLQAGLPADGA